MHFQFNGPIDQILMFRIDDFFFVGVALVESQPNSSYALSQHFTRTEDWQILCGNETTIFECWTKRVNSLHASITLTHYTQSIRISFTKLNLITTLECHNSRLKYSFQFWKWSIQRNETIQTTIIYSLNHFGSRWFSVYIFISLLNQKYHKIMCGLHEWITKSRTLS